MNSRLISKKVIQRIEMVIEFEVADDEEFFARDLPIEVLKPYLEAHVDEPEFWELRSFNENSFILNGKVRASFVFEKV